MTRLLVLLAVMLFIVGLAYLTIAAIAKEGVTVLALIAIMILILVAVGAAGALLGPPRDPPV
jgi:hypothetical protein